MNEVTPDPIMRIALGFMAAKHLFVANEIGVFEKLASGAATLDELAAATGIPYRTLRISADAMVSLGLLEREDRRYRNAAAAAAFLAGAPGPDLRPMLRFWDKLSYPRWVGLESAVRSGAGQAGFFRFSEEEQQIFSTGVEVFSAPAAAALAAAYDFGRHQRVLDVAGGTGSFLITHAPPSRSSGPVVRAAGCLRGRAPPSCARSRKRSDRSYRGRFAGGRDPRRPRRSDRREHRPRALGGAQSRPVAEGAFPCRAGRAAAARRSVDGCEPH
jgi:Dimerisation domain